MQDGESLAARILPYGKTEFDKLAMLLNDSNAHSRKLLDRSQAMCEPAFSPPHVHDSSLTPKGVPY